MAKINRIEQIVIDENAANDPAYVHLIEEFKEALIGVFRVDGNTLPVYSYLKFIELVVEDGIDEEAAVELVDNTYLNNNIQDTLYGAYIIVDDTGV